MSDAIINIPRNRYLNRTLSSIALLAEWHAAIASHTASIKARRARPIQGEHANTTNARQAAAQQIRAND
jgi:hypothetical protein